MNKDSLTLTIVIPVFNEERYLKACLEAIAAQSEKPDEVIVVNNNSTDKSVEIAKSFKFVKVIDEARQHQSFAQSAGFDAAKSDILGRIDADSMLPPDWVEKVKNTFAAKPDIVALTGAGRPYDVVLDGFGRAVFRFYNWLASSLGGTRMLWGSNCAIRRSAWLKVKNKTSLGDKYWEDQDLSFCLAAIGPIYLLKGLEIATSFRAVHEPFWRQISYQFRSVRVFYRRRGFFIAALYTLLWYTMVPLFFVVMFDSYVLKPLTHFKEPY